MSIKPGDQFAHLRVIRQTDSSLWLCECSCGGRIEVTTNHLNKRIKKSCGCRKYRGNVSKDPFNCISLSVNGVHQ